MDASDIGRLGSLSLLRRLPTESIVTSYPIDDEEVTIGRDQSCSLRLYYPAVSSLHAKITFVDRKAFLVVLGTNGVLLNDEPLFPTAPAAPGPTTVPLQNNSVIEIHKKRFRFTYPPKHLRAVLLNTPTRATPGVGAGPSATPARRPLRLSMIASAHVFTPRPSHDPQENLRVLQTPLRTPFAREAEEIVLVQSDSPRVVEEDKDLVILDEVEPAPVLPLPLPAVSHVPATPVRRTRPTLHRAVLIRSAQRVAIQREIQIEEELDAEEVEDAIGAISEEGDEEVQEIPPPPESRPEPSSWRKSLDMVKGSLGWALRGLSVEPKEEDEDEGLDVDGPQEIPEDVGEEMGIEEEYEVDEHGLVDEYTHEEHEQEEIEEEEEPSRPLGRFMSPQIPRLSQQQPRLSLGGAMESGPRRVRVVAPWKVSEIQVPATVQEEGSNSTSAPQPSVAPRSPVKREKLTDEEREAIRARRRSALATPDNFFKGQAPGSRRKLFPSLAPLASPNFAQPDEPAATSSQQADVPPSSTTSSSASITPSVSPMKVDEDEDTAVLLARMKHMAEGLKQRQSLSRQSLSISPRKREGGFSLLAPNHAGTHRPSRILIEEDAVPDDEDEDSQEPTQRDGAAPRSATNTPRMSDLRHVFGRAQLGEAGAGTPALAGVKEMFRPAPKGPAETPRMEGLQDMLETPVGYRAAPTDAEVKETEAEKTNETSEDTVEELPVPKARGKRTPAARTTRRTPVPQSAPAKSTRASSQALEDTEPAELDEGRARRTRARTAEGAVGQIPRPTRGRVAKADVAEAKEDENKPAKAPRRTRQATDSSTASEDTTDTKPVRKTRARTPTAQAAGTTRRGARAKPIEVAEDNDDSDPLDTLSHERQLTEEPQPAPAARARRGGRTKVKEEDSEESLPPSKEDATTRAPATRGKRATASKLPTAAATRNTARGHGTAAAAASAPADATIPEDKENTPEAGADESGEDTKPAVATKGRGAGKGARTRKPTGESGEESGIPAPAATRTRATRARATKA